MRVVMHSLRLILAAAALITATTGAFAAEPKNGVDYTTLQSPTPEAGNKPEVIEYFMYHCPHCFALDPMLMDWVKKQGDRIVFRRIHLGDDPQAHAFVTLEAMGKEAELHDKIFRAIHVEHNRLATDAALEDFIVKNGVDKAKYLEFFNSFGVQTKMKRGQQLANQYKLDSAPSLVIDGHYTTSPATAGHGLTSAQQAHAALFAVMDSLVAKSAQERAKK